MLVARVLKTIEVMEVNHTQGRLDVKESHLIGESDGPATDLGHRNY